MFSTPPGNPNFDETNWVIDIRRSLAEELEDVTEMQVSIFNVPKELMANAPHCYIPQQVAIGPYHYKDPELSESQSYKLAAARTVQNQLPSGFQFQHVVDQIAKHVSLIRACYHRPLGLKFETLSWIMAIDSSFLLDFLQAISSNESSLRVSSMMSHLVGLERRKSAYNYVLRDIVMLENQIPLFILRNVLEIQLSSLESADGLLVSMLTKFCEDISPFRALDNVKQHVSQSAHLLHFLYRMVVPEMEETREKVTETEEENEPGVFQQSWSILKTSFSHERWKGYFFKLLVCLPLTIASNIPIVSVLKQPMENLLATYNNSEQETNQIEGAMNDLGIEEQPLMEEIAIPSVTELVRSGIRFSPTNGNVSSVYFEAKTKTVHLPIVKLDISSEVVLRNLVAFEAANAWGPLVFTRYTELMNGIIDTAEDAKLLSERGIILNHLKSNEEAARLWNGMSKSVRFTKVPFLDRVIDEVNRFHHSRWKVKANKFTKGKSFSLWKLFQVVTFIFFFSYVTGHPLFGT